ncbi:amidohydrolase [Methylobacterium sp. PvP062]|jgi:amidohydrolase|uniref:Amidohydrolase n=1 Tax=Methylobacterium radiotolerans (strain ATCC 27329 / DSM 1819 / JCM 2831 / NBRC 15690 / NCIMB 10815 / 0-1) TaxID=426355 RepID=B1LXW1_METRJ|nr:MULTISPECIES: M20 aminoacylase family protein [Methylobacterium]MCX7331247.1 M20 family metallopeptidase [Hyphomicrobiales bacterium]GAN49404.1 amidohydrolase [Methylobacterium sp. ME121]ACB24318.1 amidohydrolase [Methylobacterium radiotolerans JCM 2831]KTS12683.1 amidohydrolase [Methylobacterium radiotolerans]KTS45771.1 amidohydrolase [Methylobacterium radiotolerans]
MSPIDRIKTYADELTALRRDLHAHPELGFEEVRTAGIVADLLEKFGCEVHRGVGGTGVVGLLKGRTDNGKRIGLRADMDALPIEEETNLPYRSTYAGKMHACGHDGHTTMLVGAARYLAETRDFDGTAVFVFQPAEEGRGGARAMLKDGLFERFPCDEIYGLHNQPGGGHGMIKLRPGPIMAAADFFDIHIRGKGIHAAQPHRGVDPIIIATGLAQALQSIVSRNADPLKSIVLSITRIEAGSAYNVIPETAHLAGTIRTFDKEIRALAGTRMRELAAGFGAAYGAEVTVDLQDVFSVLENAPEQAAAATEVATELLGADKVESNVVPKMGSEDFADMTMAVPGAYVWLGANPGPGLHNAGYNFDDSIIPIGSAFLARMVERRTAA